MLVLTVEMVVLARMVATRAKVRRTDALKARLKIIRKHQARLFNDGCCRHR